MANKKVDGIKTGWLIIKFIKYIIDECPLNKKKYPHKRIIRLSYFTGLSVGQLKMNTFKKMIRTEMRMFK